MDTSTTFADNLKLPIHRWYRYTAGYSGQWAEDVIRQDYERKGKPKGYEVLDPFAGSGTTMLAADQTGVASLGFESHPLVNRIDAAKLSWNTDALAFAAKGREIAGLAMSIDEPLYEYPPPCGEMLQPGELAGN